MSESRMPDEMTPDRFRTLAAAYGGAVVRWPAAERAAALRLADAPWAQAVLAEAAVLDCALDRWTVPAPAAALAERLAAGAPAARRWWRPARLWWPGLGAAAALAGAAAGATVAAAVAPPAAPTEAATAFGEIGGEGISS